MIRCALVFALALLASANTSLAQTKEPIGRFVADLRVASAGSAGGSRLDTGGARRHVVPPGGSVSTPAARVRAAISTRRPWRRRRLADRACDELAAGASDPGITPPHRRAIPEVTTRLTTLVPQVSMNFGHSLGWSYLSAGLGRSKVESEAALTGAATTFTPRDSGWVKTINYGGGARWFINDHLGVGFDVRWYKLSIVPASDTHPGRAARVAGRGRRRNRAQITR